MKNTPENISSLLPNEVFVFGSNEAGIHGAGAARAALKFGAQWGYGVGLYGSTYALPTKDTDLEVLSLRSIKKYVDEFKKFATDNKELTFLVTKIGTGYSGYSCEDIAPMFSECSENCILPIEFQNILDDIAWLKTDFNTEELAAINDDVSSERW